MLTLKSGLILLALLAWLLTVLPELLFSEACNDKDPPLKKTQDRDSLMEDLPKTRSRRTISKEDGSIKA